MQPPNILFDPTPYLRAPQLTMAGTLALGQALLAAVPQPTPELLARFVARLHARTQIARDALTVRRRESAPLDHSEMIGLDGLADGLWTLLRDRLQSWSPFEGDESSRLLGDIDARDAAVLAEAREQAERARELDGRLFGADGLSFTQRSYPEQAQHMASILRLIDEDDLSVSIDALVGPEILVALRCCQVRYDAMVQARMRRDEARSSDLGQLRRALQYAISRYAGALLTLADEDDPASVEIVRDALRPIDVARARLTRSRSRTLAEADDAWPEADLEVNPHADPDPQEASAAE